MSESLPIIGHDRANVAKLGKALHDAARGVGDYTPRVETPRGERFEVRLPYGHIVRVTLVLDRVERGADA